MRFNCTRSASVPLHYRLRPAVPVTPVVTCRALSVCPHFVRDGYRAEMAAGKAVVEKSVWSVCIRHRLRIASELPRAGHAVVMNLKWLRGRRVTHDTRNLREREASLFLAREVH